MNILNLTLPSSKIVEYDVPQDQLAYYKVSLEDLKLERYNGGISVRNLKTNQIILNCISYINKPFANCCGLAVWENLHVHQSVSQEKMFDPWIQWILGTLGTPIIIVLVRYCDQVGPKEYTVSTYQLFANHGELIAQYRNVLVHPNHVLEIMALMPPGGRGDEIRKLTYGV